MDIRKIKISDIKIEKYNPRVDLEKDSDEFKSIDKSLSTFGMLEPVVVNKNGNILISGHQRLKVLREHKVTEVDALFVDLDKEKEKVLNLALNKIKGNWDYQKLTDLLGELVDDGDIDFEVTGFSKFEIDTLLNDYNHIDDLIQDDFAREDYTGKLKEDFIITFTFPKEKEDIVNEFIRKHGKKVLVKMIIEKADEYNGFNSKKNI